MARRTRAQFNDRLAIALESKETAEAVDPDALAARRQRVRDRAGDEPPPRSTGRARK